MITYNKVERFTKPDTYDVIAPGPKVLGMLDQEVDGFYYFYPIRRQGYWDSATMKDIAMKLEALNESWSQKLKQLNVK